jgi:hypothetical protein
MWRMMMLVPLAALLAGCASIVSGTTQEMTFQSNPDDVLVTVNGRPLGKTPLTLQMDKKEDQSVVFSKDGYKPVTMPLTSTLDPWFWGNILLGGFIGSTTDGISGAVHQYSPAQYFVSLQRLEAGTMETGTLKSQREKAKDFIVKNYPTLKADISKGGGEELNALMRLLNIAQDQQADALRKLHALSEAFSDAPQFADQVTALYVKEKVGALPVSGRD